MTDPKEFEKNSDGNTNLQNKTNDQINENSEAENDFDFEDDNIDMDDNYGTSGEKYGWYNGFSDDVIDDAFEGDPENTWNVD